MTIQPSRLPRIAFTIALVLLLAGTALRAKTKNRDLDPIKLLQTLKIAPNTEAITTREGYVLHGIQTGAADAKPQAGDTVTALVVLGSFDKLSLSQWIIRLQLAEKASEDDSPRAKTSDTTLYTNTGENFTFHSERSVMKLETLGPIKADTKSNQSLPVKRREISVATDFLSLDLNRTALVLQRMMLSKETPRLSLSSGSKPFSNDEVNVQRPRADALKLTSDDQRSFSGSLPALDQFLDIVRFTPDLQDILFQIIDKPSLIDVVRHGANRSINFNFQAGGHSNEQEIFWPETKHEDFGVLAFNLEIFKKPVLTVVLYVTTPRPPLLVSAGIVGIVALKPKPDMSDKFVVVRVLSATAGNETVPPPEPKP